MKKQLFITSLVALVLVSCSKNEPEATTPVVTTTDDANKRATAAVEADKAAAARTEAARAEAAARTEAAKAETAKISDAVNVEAVPPDAAKPEAAKATGNETVQMLIDKAKSLIAGNRFSDAAGVLQQLSGQSLNAEQKTLVESLKEQIQKALAAKATENATGAAGNLLKK
jgi:hypothetical protein